MPEVPTATTTKDEIILEGLFDYAGLFPPANLDMQQTVKNWYTYANCDDSWMLARLIIPVSRLNDFKSAAKDILPSAEEQDMWQISVLLPPVSSEGFESAVQATIDFNLEDCGAVANVVEFKASSTIEIDKALSILHDDLFPFIEIPIDEDPRGLLASLSGAIAGAKVRTGGIVPELYPSAEHLARFIHSCALSGQPFKATAGLHHPYANINSNVGVREFGFLSILQSAAFASTNDCNVGDIMEILLCDTPDLSSFSEGQLEQVRAELFNSIGSCSFNEARSDLRLMGMLKE